ncbi:hypothetical protein D9599_28410 [Roseomonas sp. KE2513]|nr:hypothetical protein [Roseomonas sp. KE2513]
MAALEAAGDFVLDEGKRALLSWLPEGVRQARRSLTIMAGAHGSSRNNTRTEGRHVVGRERRIIKLAGARMLSHLEPSHRLLMRRRGAQEWGMADGTIGRRLP